MKDAKGHGSNGRGGLSPTEQKMADHGSRVLGAIGAMGVAAQHGIPTEHLNSQGHAYGSPEAIRDFTRQYGGPRDHAAEARGFNRGAREINRLKRQGK